jgi:hypothetical protein
MAKLQLMKKNAWIFRWLSVALLLACTLPTAHAQWSWKDKEGRRIFSDQPPPSSIPDKDVLRRPGGSRAASPSLSTSDAATGASSSGATTTATTAASPKISGKDSELEKRKKEADAAEKATQKAQADQFAAARQENCERAKRAKSAFDSGQRIAQTNAKGEREIMSDAARGQESQRLQEIIAKDCT